MFNVGIIGLGVGEAHIQGYLAHSACNVVSVCDFNEDVFQKAKLKYPQFKVFKDPAEILNDTEVDIISIASWDNFHHEQIIQGLKNNKHLFVEKPICLSAKEALDVIACLNKNPELKISSNLILRKTGRFSNLKDRMLKNELGDISYISGAYNYGRLTKLTEGWRGKIDYYSVIHGGGVHLIDLMLWLLQSRISEVSAFGNNIHTQDSLFRFNDMVVSNLKFENGAIGNLSVNFGCVSPHFHQFEVYGTKLTFINRLKYAELYHLRDAKNFNKTRIVYNHCSRDYRGLEKIYNTYKNVSKELHIHDFVDAIIEGREPSIGKKDIFDALSVSFAIEKAVETGKVEKVSYLY